jgi:hypothetical protein
MLVGCPEGLFDGSPDGELDGSADGKEVGSPEGACVVCGDTKPHISKLATANTQNILSVFISNQRARLFY